MSFMRGIFGVRERTEFLRSSLSSWVSDRLHLELPVEWVDSRVRVGNGGARLFLPMVGVDCDFQLCPNLFEESCLKMGCRFLFTSSIFAEPDHLRLLVLHLLLHGRKHLEKLVTIKQWLELVFCIPSGKALLEWESSVLEIWASDRLGRRFTGSAASITFPFSFGSKGRL